MITRGFILREVMSGIISVWLLPLIGSDPSANVCLAYGNVSEAAARAERPTPRNLVMLGLFKNLSFVIFAQKNTSL